MRSYFDNQRRIALVVWVAHEHVGPDGTDLDHHLMLAMADHDYESGDPEALLRGVEREVNLPGWLDLFPIPEVETLRDFGTVVWEHESETAEDLDPLDFRFTWSPLRASPDEIGAFRGLLEAVPAVVRVEGADQRLWKGDREIEHTTRFFVEWDEARGAVHDAITAVSAAARDAGLANSRSSGTGWRLPSDPRIETTTLYDLTT